MRSVCLDSDEKLVAAPLELRLINGTLVLEVELQGIHQASQLISTCRWKKAVIFSDLQAALESPFSAGSLARQHLVRQIYQIYCQLKEIRCDVEFVWVPGH